MKRICCACGISLGEKEPLKDRRETHSYCDTCFEVLLRPSQERMNARHLHQPVGSTES